MGTYKPILDACCDGKMFYFDKNDPRVLFQDIRCEETTLCDGRRFSVEPDVIGDFTSMDFPADMPNCLKNEATGILVCNAEDVLRWLLRRYALVEKSKLEELKIAHRAKEHGAVWLNPKEVEYLFPEIAEEV